MLAILPVITYMGSFMVLTNLRPSWDWRRVAIRMAVLMGCYTVITVEILSLLKTITVLSLVIIWGFPILVMTLWFLRRVRQGLFLLKPTWEVPFSWMDKVLIFCILLVVVVTALVAWFAPPNTGDSLTTHMSRVAHWAQEKSISFYATGIEFQNYYPPFPGMVILQTYILAGGDHLANFSQWFAMLISLLGVSLLTKDLGANRRGQILAALFLGTLPMGIAQSSSTMTDYLVTALIIAVASESLVITKNVSRWTSIIFLASSAGLAVLSKPTAFAYLLPFALFNSIVILRKMKLKNFILSTVLVIVIVLGLNSGYFIRNLKTYRHPLGRPDRVALHSNDVPLWKSMVSNTLRNASLHSSTPFSPLNYQIYRGILAVHVKLGLDIIDPRTSIHSVFGEQRLSTSEVTTGNTLHAMIIILVVIMLLLKRKGLSKWIFPYIFVTIATFLILSVAFKFSVFGSRYHIPFFALFAPIVGLALDRFFPKPISFIVGIMFVVLSLPWLLSISSRPLIPLSQWTSRESVLTKPRKEQYLSKGQFEAYFTISEMINESRCSKVHLILSGSREEYPFWVYLKAPGNSIHIEWNIADTPSAQFTKENFESCAVICDSTCDPSLKTLRGFPLVYEASGMRLFLDEEK